MGDELPRYIAFLCGFWSEVEKDGGKSILQSLLLIILYAPFPFDSRPEFSGVLLGKIAVTSLSALSET